MASQALLTPDPPLELQRDVQRKLGRCLLRLQQYEILLKALVAHGDIAGPPAELQSVWNAQVACAQKKTLGSLVGMLTERHLNSAEEDRAVRCLREAETRFATEGWTLLNTATPWIRAKDPDQHPQRYGCGSWRQVIHESRQFEIRRTVNIERGCGEVWYRSRQEEASMQGKKSS